MPSTERVGRFAPSPTGRLHLGSLVAALGSALDARRLGGRWLLRMEDLDRPRIRPGAADDILRTLETLGFEWDGPILYQSARIDAYAEAVAQLGRSGLTFECSCSRSTVSSLSGETGYPGTCRHGPTRPGPTALRFRVDRSAAETIADRVRGVCRVDLARLGDVVIRRRDGQFAYQLAVVVDDAAQGVTDVVRGGDLLESSAWQRALQRALGLPEVTYAHLPLIVEADGTKLAKSRRSIPVEPAHGAASLVSALRLLGQAPPAGLAAATPAAVWAWGQQNWSIGRVPDREEVRL